MSTTYTQRQIMLSLAYLAYTGEPLPGFPSPDAQIKSDLTQSLSSNAATPIPPIAGDWSIVWGPVSYTVPGSYYQDNMMYVVELSDPGNGPAQYVVAVRGTDGKVALDWLFEDFDIIQTMPWPLGSSGSNVVGQISESTSIALTILVNMHDSSSGQTLIQFLQSEMDNLSASQASVCFTGHSLGATLCSTLALYMRDNQSAWDPKSKAIVTTINFAGPTAGDQEFATYFDNAFIYTGSSPLQYWSAPGPANSYADCVRANLDIAPMIWNVTTMNQVEDIYTGHDPFEDIFAPLGTGEIISYIENATGQNQYTPILGNQPVLTVPFVEKADLPPLNANHWVSEAIYQHRASYPNQLGVPSLLTLFPLTMFTNFQTRVKVSP